MTLTELLTELSSRGLSIQSGGDNIAVVGNLSTLSEDLKQALATHKDALLPLVNRTAAAPAEATRPAWWSHELSNADNEAVDIFLSPMSPPNWRDSLTAETACGRCGGFASWWDVWGVRHCLRCDSWDAKLPTGLLQRIVDVLRRERTLTAEELTAFLEPQPKPEELDSALADLVRMQFLSVAPTTTRDGREVPRYRYLVRAVVHSLPERRIP